MAHKTEHLDRDRVIYIGPTAQCILRPYLLRPADKPCFSPRESARQAREKLDENRPPRKTIRYPSEIRRVENEKRAAGRRANRRGLRQQYSTESYAQAIERACKLAFGETGTRWSPNQLRHTAATKFRKLFGLEAAQVLLGHSRADVTQIYAERDAALARSVAKQVC
jgi:integrase